MHLHRRASFKRRTAAGTVWNEWLLSAASDTEMNLGLTDAALPAKSELAGSRPLSTDPQHFDLSKSATEGQSQARPAVGSVIMNVDGECLCRVITYKAIVDPARCAVCHCQSCQVNSGTAFGWIVHVQDRQFELTSGKLKVFETIADSGRRRRLSFCSDCGTRIYAQTPGEPDAFFGLRVGTVRQRHLLPPKQQVWCRSAQSWAFDLQAIPRKEIQDR